MGGLRRLAKTYGSIVISGKTYVWDYASDKPVPEDDMPAGSERWKRSERVKWEGLKEVEGGKYTGN